jgi:hypothetical protein
MTAFQNTVTIARPADEVFAFLADFGNIPVSVVKLFGPTDRREFRPRVSGIGV